MIPDMLKNAPMFKRLEARIKVYFPRKDWFVVIVDDDVLQNVANFFNRASIF